MKVIAAIFIISAMVIGIVPQFTDCESQGRAIELGNGKTVPMKCHWSAQAEIPLAVTLLAVGVLMWIKNSKESRLILSILGIVLGVFVILIPTYLFGVCASFEMLCNSLMKPILIFFGTVTTIASVIGLGLSSRVEPPNLE